MPINIPQPSMALNDEGLEKYSEKFLGVGVKIDGFYQMYRMWNTWTVGERITAEHIIDHVAAVADGAPDHYLRVLILNAHGSGASISLGAGIRALTPSFAKWRGRIANIWICSCKIVDMKTPRFQDPAKPPDFNDGNLFCSGLAKLTGAYVVGSRSTQSLSPLTVPWGHVLNWEGQVFRYEPQHGSVDWHYHYGDGLLPLTVAPPPPIAVPPHFRDLQGGPGSFWRGPRDGPHELRFPVPPHRRPVR